VPRAFGACPPPAWQLGPLTAYEAEVDIYRAPAAPAPTALPQLIQPIHLSSRPQNGKTQPSIRATRAPKNEPDSWHATALRSLLLTELDRPLPALPVMAVTDNAAGGSSPALKPIFADSKPLGESSLKGCCRRTSKPWAASNPSVRRAALPQGWLTPELPSSITPLPSCCYSLPPRGPCLMSPVPCPLPRVPCSMPIAESVCPFGDPVKG